MSDARDRTNGDSSGERRLAGAPCPICGAPVVARFRPFCSQRCADVDLGRWLTGAYTVAAEEEDAPERQALSLDPREDD